ncbi:hypothetical protein 162322416 [Organic Lake phycodnavirus 1]|jgi:hypothetical protein|nr:hypothetical protein 162322416 [Organic Lake phycodnavirus 1]
MNNIYVISVTFLAFIILYIYVNVSSKQQKCNIIDDMDYPALSVPDLSGIPIKDIIFKSAYNCCCVGGMKNDYVSLCALKNCYRAGARVLDMQIFSLNSEPVISASTVNQNEYKELYNYLGFSETMNHIKNTFLNTNMSPNNNELLCINLRINSNNKALYNKISNTLIETFTDRAQMLLPGDIDINKDLNTYSLNELKHKIIIMVDLNASPQFRDSFGSTDLSRLALITFGDGFKYHSLYANEASLQSGVELSSIYPNKTAYSNNYDYVDKGKRNKFNFIFMNFQKRDNHLTKYLDDFNSFSFKQVYNME